MSEETVLGDTYRDTVTDFIGAATGRATYIDGTVRVLLEALDSDHRVAQEWFDECRLERYEPRRP